MTAEALHGADGAGSAGDGHELAVLGFPQKRIADLVQRQRAESVDAERAGHFCEVNSLERNDGRANSSIGYHDVDIIAACSSYLFHDTIRICRRWTLNLD